MTVHDDDWRDEQMRRAMDDAEVWFRSIDWEAEQREALRLLDEAERDYPRILAEFDSPALGTLSRSVDSLGQAAQNAQEPPAQHAECDPLTRGPRRVGAADRRAAVHLLRRLATEMPTDDPGDNRIAILLAQAADALALIDRPNHNNH